MLFVAINVIGYVRGLPFDQILMVAISQVIGMIPEGLPVAMTIAPAVGVQRMARRHVVVRRLAAVETLGSTTVICSDKTGTLTRNEMTVTAVLLANGREFNVSGSGYVPEGGFTLAGVTVVPADVADLRTLLEAGVLCNDARLRGPTAEDLLSKSIGDPTEVALITLEIKAGLQPDEPHALSGHGRLKVPLTRPRRPRQWPPCDLRSRRDADAHGLCRSLDDTLRLNCRRVARPRRCASLGCERNR